MNTNTQPATIELIRLADSAQSVSVCLHATANWPQDGRSAYLRFITDNCT